MHHVFIDTNAYLSFYRFSNDDLEELRKLEAAVNSKSAKLYVTTHLLDEFRRNREGVIAQSLKSLRDSKLPKAFPQLAMNYDSYTRLREALKSYSDLLSELTSKIEEDARSNALHADQLIARLFESAESLSVDDEIIARAKRRFDLGNPPGKEGSYGDAVNWEALLAQLPPFEDLLLITSDTDYLSKVDPSRISEFLRVEWEKVKLSSVELYPTLTAFFRKYYPNIKLAVELEKEQAIRKLADSGNFNSTHAAIANLAAYPDFSPDQAYALLQAALSNSQIYWIGTDDDVQNFFLPLYRSYSDMLTSAEQAGFEEHFGA